MNNVVQINRDTREQCSDEEQANDMLCMLLVHDIRWPHRELAQETLVDIACICAAVGGD